MNEIWKDIYFIENGVEWDYRGLYQVSNFGRVKSFHNGKEKIMKLKKTSNNYLYVQLRKNNKVKNFRVHRLVAHMFIKGYFVNAQVNHIDENKTNNHVSNLEWCTREYNINYGTRNEKHSETRKNKPHGKASKLISRYDLNLNLIDTKYCFEFIEDGFIGSSILYCCSGKQLQHKGYIFKYHEEVE